MKLQHDSIGRKCSLKTKTIVAVTYGCILLLLVSCASLNEYGRYSGLKRVVSAQYPPLDGLVWSRSSSSKVLLSASAIGYELALRESEVYILDTSTGERRVIATTDSGLINAQSWSFNEERVILNIDASTPGYENRGGLWIWNAKSETLDFLTLEGKAIWSPDGKVIAVFDSSDSEEQLLRMIDSETKNEEVQVIGETREIGYVWGADWSSDGKHIVISLGGAESVPSIDLFVYDITTHRLVKITQNGNNLNPVWEPLGNRIAYIKQGKGSASNSLHLIDSNGRCDMEIPYINEILSISWLPDGQKLGFLGPDGIYVLDLNVFVAKYVSSNICP